MKKLPVHLLHEILFRLQPKSLAKLQCVDKSLQSHISDDLIFQSEYFSRLGSTLINISSFGSKLLPLISSISDTESPSVPSFNPLPIHYYIIGSSSGLLLLYINGLCVVNPLTKKFKFLDHSSAKLFPKLLYLDRRIPSTNFVKSVEKTRIGFAVDRNKQRFKIVYLFNRLANRIDTVYQFEIYSEDSWRLSQTKLICSASEHYNITDNTKPVYVNGCLYWLRIDGSIIAFDVESEEARLIPIEFPEKVNSKVVFCVAENRVNLVCASKEVIRIYVLEMEMEMEMENMCWRWNLVKEMENVKFDEGNLLEWSVEAFDGRFVVVREGPKIKGGGVIHIHGFEIDKWKVLGSIPWWGDKCRDFYFFKPCWDSVVGLDEMLMMNDGDYDDGDYDDGDGHGRVTTLRKIIRFIRYFAQV